MVSSSSFQGLVDWDEWFPRQLPAVHKISSQLTSSSFSVFTPGVSISQSTLSNWSRHDYKCSPSFSRNFSNCFRGVHAKRPYLSVYPSHIVELLFRCSIDQQVLASSESLAASTLPWASSSTASARQCLPQVPLRTLHH